jgi:hypothetical protein
MRILGGDATAFPVGCHLNPSSIVVHVKHAEVSRELEDLDLGSETFEIFAFKFME